MQVRATRIAALAVAAVFSTMGVAACGSDDNKSSSSSSGTASSGASSAKGGKIALLLPESKTARYETQDRPLFEAKVKELCADCSVVYSNADQDASKQKQQAEAALAQGVKVMVLDPVDGAAAASIVAQANSKQVPVSLAGEQYMTVYKPLKPLAEKAAEWAVKLAQGEQPTDATDKENNGSIDVPTLKIAVTPVTADKVKDTVVADGFWKAAEICTGEYAAACKKYSIG